MKPLTLVLLLATPALADTCFDFSKPVRAPLKASLPLGKGDVGDSGKHQHAWARLRGVVKKPIGAVLAWLEDPANFRDPTVDELTVKPVAAGPHLARVDVHQLVKPFPFVRIEWVDEWAFSIVQGTVERPEKIVVAYQKREGTSHIAHFCGTLVLERLDDGSTTSPSTKSRPSPAKTPPTWSRASRGCWA